MAHLTKTARVIQKYMDAVQKLCHLKWRIEKGMRPHSRIGYGTSSSDGTDIECPEEGVRDEDTAANATQPGAFHVEGIGSNRDEAGL
jgi:hypothetical protein